MFQTYLKGLFNFQRKRLKTKQDFFFNLEIATVYPSSVSTNLAKYLIQMKHIEIEQLKCKEVKNGHLSIGRGFHELTKCFKGLNEENYVWITRL